MTETAAVLLLARKICMEFDMSYDFCYQLSPEQSEMVNTVAEIIGSQMRRAAMETGLSIKQEIQRLLDRLNAELEGVR